MRMLLSLPASEQLASLRPSRLQSRQLTGSRWPPLTVCGRPHDVDVRGWSSREAGRCEMGAVEGSEARAEAMVVRWAEAAVEVVRVRARGGDDDEARAGWKASRREDAAMPRPWTTRGCYSGRGEEAALGARG